MAKKRPERKEESRTTMDGTVVNNVYTAADLDQPKQEGYDSDHPLSSAQVGKCGVAIDSLQDMEELCDGIPLAEVSTSMTINATTPVLLAMYIAAAEKQGADKGKLRGTVQNDILKEYVARNTYIFGPAPSMREGHIM